MQDLHSSPPIPLRGTSPRERVHEIFSRLMAPYKSRSLATLCRWQNKPLYVFLSHHMSTWPSTHSVPGRAGGKVVAPATKGGAAGMVQGEYDSKISCLHSPFSLEGRKGLSRSPFIHTGAGRRPPSFTIYHLQFSLCVPRLPRLHRKRHKKRSPLSRASFFVYETIFSFLFRN